MDIQTIVVGGGPVSSLIILRTHDSAHDSRSGSDSGTERLPIRIGPVEATAISMGVDGTTNGRPMTHDLLVSAIEALGARVLRVEITDVRGTTFYAHVVLSDANGQRVTIDARPSDAIALAVRTHVHIYADEDVIEKATLPDFASIEEDEKEQELKDFHAFVEGLSPEDFDTSE